MIVEYNVIFCTVLSQDREDQVTFQAYLAKRRERSAESSSASLSHPVITTVDDPDFDDKIQAAIRQQLAEPRS